MTLDCQIISEFVGGGLRPFAGELHSFPFPSPLISYSFLIHKLQTIPQIARDCVAVIAEVKRIDGPLQVKYWGCQESEPIYDSCGVDAYVNSAVLSSK